MGKSRVGQRSIAALLLFLVSHAWLALGYAPEVSDAKLYALYAFILKDATRVNRSPYEHFEYSKRQSAQSLGMPALRPDQVTLEYPPLALQSLRIPLAFVPNNEAGIPGLAKTDAKAWAFGFRLTYFIVYAVLVAGMAWWLGRKKLEWQAGLLVATVGGIALAYVLYDRLDLWLGLLLLGGLATLVTGHKYAALALLAVAVNFKLVPALLVPLFVLGVMPASVLSEGLLKRRALRSGLVACAVFAAACVAVFLPFRLVWGPRVWDFLAYHSQRGFEIESTWASLLLIAGHLGYPIHMAFQFGAVGLAGPGLPLFAKLSSVVALAAVGLAYWLALRSLLRNRESPAIAAAPARPLAAVYPQTFVWAAFALLALSIASSKVFSPQYLCWFLPCFLLVKPPSSPRAAAPLLVFLLACGLTTAVFPWLWADVVRPLALGPKSPVRLPGIGVTLVMLARNLAWAVFCVLALRQLSRPPLQIPVSVAGPVRKRRRRNAA